MAIQRGVGLLLGVIALALLCACQTGGGRPTGDAGTPITKAEVEGILATQRVAWNKGDLKAFVGLYWQSPKMTFCGSGGITRGSKDLLEKYRKGYPDAAARGTLTFALHEMRPLGSQAVLVLGRYELERVEPDHGWFTLVLQRIEGHGVRITHDHTSSAVLK